VSKGGLPVEENLQVLCRTCTAIKRDYTLSNDDFRMYLALYEAQWREPENDKHRIRTINMLIRRDLEEKAKSTPTNDQTNGQDVEGLSAS